MKPGVSAAGSGFYDFSLIFVRGISIRMG